MRIIIVDDDPFVCISLKTILQAEPGIEVCASGSSGEEAVHLYEEIQPDILLMDIQMGSCSGLDAGAEILEKHPDARILFLTTFSDDEYIIRALRIGAKGYLIKQDIETIAPALRSVMSGQSVFGSEIVTKIPKMMGKPQRTDLGKYGILDREMDVIELVAKGLNNKEIAQSLYLSEGTVRNYLSAILDKLSLRDRTQLAVFYYKNMGD